MKIRNNSPATIKELKNLLDYDPTTGEFTWKVSRGQAKAGDTAGNINKQDRYIAIGVMGALIRGHRLAWAFMTGRWPKAPIDHKNLIRHDNRWENLRLATTTQNMYNRDKLKNNTSGFRGVMINKKSGKPYARARFKGRIVHLGHHETKEEAHAAYLKFASENHGEFFRAS